MGGGARGLSERQCAHKTDTVHMKHTVTSDGRAVVLAYLADGAQMVRVAALRALRTSSVWRPSPPTLLPQVCYSSQIVPLLLWSEQSHAGDRVCVGICMLSMRSHRSLKLLATTRDLCDARRLN